MLEPRWRPVQGHLGESPFETSSWAKAHFTTQAVTPWHAAALRGSHARASDDGIMDHETDGDGAINLSTSQRPSAATTPNGNVDYDDQETVSSLAKALKQQQQRDKERDKEDNGKSSPQQQQQQQQQPQLSPQQASAAPAASQAPPPPPQLMMSPPASGLHHMQQLLQQQLLSPAQLQSLMQQHSLFLQQQQHHHHQQQLAELGRKQLEQAIQQLQEQLQLNVIQQTHLLQTGDKKKAGGPLQQLALQQQQLMQQLQMVQRQYVLQQAQAGAGVSASDVHSPWKELPTEGIDPHHNPVPHKGIAGLNGLLSSMGLGRRDGVNGVASHQEDSTADSRMHPLYGHGVCKWPGCEAICDDFPSFLQHLNSEHTLDDRSTAQARVQMQVVSQLELQLQKERDRLQAMMHHLHLAKQQAGEAVKVEPASDLFQNAPSLAKLSLSSVLLSQPPPSLSTSALVSAVRSPVLQPPTPTMGGPIRRRISDKSALSLAGGTGDIKEKHYAGNDVIKPEVLEQLVWTHKISRVLEETSLRRRLADRVALDICEEIQRNREFYKNADVRPPFTYASLIRQSIIESPDKQLTLNEIYNWFQNTFCYFRRNAATWKNAVRHNLSLHKCFMRVENVKGAVWTVDEVEFYKRRPQRCTTGGVPSKSPTLTHSPTLYGDGVNSNMQVAPGFCSFPDWVNSIHHAKVSEVALGDSNMAFLNNSMSASTTTSPDKVSSSPTEHRSSVDSSVVHIKQEGGPGGPNDTDGLMHLIKHEILDHSVELDESDEREFPSMRLAHHSDEVDETAEDLSMVQEDALDA
ncbi:forkhead box protein P1-like isoform X4 [Bacillus rossius redtenbacheri]|uniref:forkhead box protein P1-like isoform X4 n=1 Tax=Bacillus rossius redtenbacheri TaxID=93214 RepID=UPI002FDE54DD